MAKQNIDIVVSPKDNGASSFLDGLAQKARQFRREDALGGERALGSFLNKGAGGLAEFGMSALGFGAAGVIANFAAESAAKLTESINKVEEGKATLTEVFAEFIDGLPILGNLSKALRNSFEIVTGIAQAFIQMNQVADKNAATRLAKTSLYEAGREMAGKIGSAAQNSINDMVLSPDDAKRFQIEALYQAQQKQLSEQRSAVWAGYHGGGDSEYDAQTSALNKAQEQSQSAHDIALFQIQIEADERLRKQHQAALDAIKGDEEESQDVRLRAAGKFLEADLDQARDAAQKKRDQANQDAEKYSSQEQGFLERRVAAINAMEQAQADDAFRNQQRRVVQGHGSALSAAVSSTAEVLRRAGRGSDADRMTIAESYNSQLRSLALQLGDPSLDQYERNGVIGTMANLVAARGYDLSRLNFTDNFSGRAATGLSDQDRFLGGVSDSIIGGNALIDTARYGKQAVEQAELINDKLQQIIDSGGDVLTNILSAVGAS